jgi:hypothetical protein
MKDLSEKLGQFAEISQGQKFLQKVEQMIGKPSHF